MSGLWPVLAVVSAAFAAALAVPPPRRAPTVDRAPAAAAPHDAGRRAGSGVGADRSAGRDEESPLLFRLVSAAAVALGAVVLLGGTVGLVAAVVAAPTCWWVTGRMEPPAVRRRRARMAAEVPQAVDLMAACLAAGLSPETSLEHVAPVLDEPLAGELAGVCARLRLGVDPATLWRDLAAHPQLGGLGRTVSRAVESGASVSDAMLRLSEDLRRQARAEVETRARAVGVKAAVPLGVCLLPAFVLVGVVPLVAGSLSVLVP